MDSLSQPRRNRWHVHITLLATILVTSALTNSVGSTVVDIWPNLEEIHAQEQVVRVGKSRLSLNVEIPAPYKLNPGSPLEYRVDVETSAQQPNKRMMVQDGKFPLQIPLTLTEGQTEIRASVSFVYCRDGDAAVCIIKSMRWIIPVKATSDGKEEMRLEHSLIPLQLENQDRSL